MALDDKCPIPHIAYAAYHLLGVHVSTGAAERNWKLWKQLYGDPHRCSLHPDNAEDMVMIKANLKKVLGDDYAISLSYYDLE